MKHVILVLLLLVMSLPALSDEPVQVAAAANLQKVLTAAFIPRFEQKTGERVLVSYGATGLLAKQLENGAPYTVFVSADRASVDKLVKEGFLDAVSERDYAVGKAVMWRSGPLGAPKTLRDLDAPGISKIAIANPAVAPYGLAAQQALVRAGLWDRLKGKLVYAENISQALQFASSGNADVALTALSLVVDRKDGSYAIIPASMHAPIVQSLALTPKAPPAARAFAQFLTSPANASIWKQWGYLPPAAR